jgi:hypothetical protein
VSVAWRWFVDGIDGGFRGAGVVLLVVSVSGLLGVWVAPKQVYERVLAL